jgi:hypothetical protein
MFDWTDAPSRLGHDVAARRPVHARLLHCAMHIAFDPTLTARHLIK